MITIRCGRCSVKKSLCVGPTDWPSSLICGRLILARQKGAAGIRQWCKKGVSGKEQKMRRFGESLWQGNEREGGGARRSETRERITKSKIIPQWLPRNRLQDKRTRAILSKWYSWIITSQRNQHWFSLLVLIVLYTIFFHFFVCFHFLRQGLDI